MNFGQAAMAARLTTAIKCLNDEGNFSAKDNSGKIAAVLVVDCESKADWNGGSRPGEAADTGREGKVQQGEEGRKKVKGYENSSPQ